MPEGTTDRTTEQYCTVTRGNKEKPYKIRKEHQKNNMSLEKLAENPMHNLGYGIIAYSNNLWSMIVGFSILSILAIPSMLVYKDGIGFHDNAATLRDFSLGNLGYSSVECATIPAGLGKMLISCPYG